MFRLYIVIIRLYVQALVRITVVVAHLGPQYYKRMSLTLSLLMMCVCMYVYIYIYIYGTPCKAINFNVVFIWTYVWQR
jgi:hypothetical protein